MEKLIPISITQAKLTALNLDLDGPVPKFYATVSLLMENGDRLTSINVGADWSESKNLDPSIEMIKLIAELKDATEVIVTRHINRFQKVIDIRGRTVSPGGYSGGGGGTGPGQ